MRLRYIVLAATLATCGMAVFLSYIWTRPTTLSFAVGSPHTDENARLVTGLAQYLGRNRENIRLRVVPTDNSETSAKLLSEGKVDLAIVRSDHTLPVNGHTVAIWQRNGVFLLTPLNAPLTSVVGLVNRRVGIVRGQTLANRLLLDLVLKQYEIPLNSVTKIDVAEQDVQKAFQDGLIDAVMVVGPPAGSLVSQVVAAVGEAGAGAPNFLPIAEADAIVQRLPALESLEIVRGTYGGNPPRPTKNFNTLGAAHRLLAQENLDEGVVADLTRLLFTARPSLVTIAPLANRLEAPETDKGSAVPVHIGAAAYLDGEEKTFFDRYGDWFYIGIMAFSLFGSGLAAVASRSSAHNQRYIAVLTSRLVSVMRSARLVQDMARLDDLEHDVDEIVMRALVHASDVSVDSNMLEAFNVALTQARHVLSERRHILMRNTLQDHVASPKISIVASS
jgi:TRAP-type uncharacterized transport system substrate-binding protein